jgi:hypothetical protein
MSDESVGRVRNDRHLKGECRERAECYRYPLLRRMPDQMTVASSSGSSEAT